jgi:hypothetical protein
MAIKKLITVVSHPRSGSSYFVSQANKIQQIRGMMEPFHQDEAIIENHLQGLYEAVNHRLGNGSLSLRELVTHSPLNYIEAIQQEISQDYLLFKIFPKHLPDDKLKLLINHSDQVIYLLRNVLHSFISSEIAKQLNRYGGVNTSELKMTFTPKAFIWWINFIVNHYNSAGFSPDDQSSLIHYEQLLSYDSVPAWFAQQLEAHFGHGFTFTDEGHLPLKQDLRISACDKVSNPGEMTAWLEHHNVAYLIDSSKPSNYNDLLRLAGKTG